jgi:hypothetical protein
MPLYYNKFSMLSSRIFSALLLALLLFRGLWGAAQSTDIRNSYKRDTALRRLVIERAMIYAPSKDWLYSHNASITKFKNRLIAIYGRSLWIVRLEDEQLLLRFSLPGRQSCLFLCAGGKNGVASPL